MSVIVTGATGQYGRLVVESLLKQGVKPSDIVATGRDITKIVDMAERGVRTAAANYEDGEALRIAFAGAEKVLLVSGTGAGTRVEQHRNVIEAAKQAGATLIAYSSATRADTSDALVNQDHKATEQILEVCGVPTAVLRNNIYLDTYVSQAPRFIAQGAVIGASGSGRLSAATRLDLAEGAARILLSENPAGIYELAGDRGFTNEELAQEISRVSGQQVAYRNMSPEEYAQSLEAAGLPPRLARLTADSHRAIENDDFHVQTGELSKILGRPTTTMEQAVRDTVQA